MKKYKCLPVNEMLVLKYFPTLEKKKKPKKTTTQGNVIEAVNQRTHTSNQL